MIIPVNAATWAYAVIFAIGLVYLSFIAYLIRLPLATLSKEETTELAKHMDSSARNPKFGLNESSSIS
jgi:hypothetical protein